ncbi:hypothetical protein [Legionella donaldsonii]|uniref:hypothetical protein n=1 Tax=Legionella donaldsonii TaxID=45060 RepID=UPI00399CA23A
MMKIVNLLKRLTIALSLGFSITAQANDSRPVFNIEPVVKAPTQITANGTGFATYRVTNTSIFNRTLVMQPISGIIQLTGGAGACPYPFPLAVGQSCLLRLQLFGSEIPRPLFYGPVVCKTRSATDLRPDPFLCSKPKDSDVLRVRVTPSVPATIDASPNVRTFSVGGTATITVTNTSASAFAQNIAAQIPLGSPLTVSSNSCGVQLAPGSSCTIIFTSAVAVAPTGVIISGTNTNQETITLQAVFATLTATPTNLQFTVGANGVITVQNVSPITANNVVPNLVAPITLVNNTCAPTLAPNATCTITVTSAVSVASTPITITGTNTSNPPATVNVTVAPVIITTSPPAQTPPTPTLQYEANQTQVLQITNTQPPGGLNANGLNVNPVVPAGMTAVSTCPAALPPQNNCNITFGGNTPQTATVNIAGTNTNTIPIVVQIVADPIVTVSPLGALVSIDNNGAVQTAVTVTNTSPTGAVTGISATLPVSWVGTVNLDDSQCANLPANTSCQLLFSSNTPFIPAVLPITTTSPIANPLEFAIGFTSGSSNDIVFMVDTGTQTMTLVTPADNSPNIWGSVLDLNTGATDPNNGAQNTQDIIDTYGNDDYAANNCTEFFGSGVTTWYLPAINQVNAIYTNLLNVGGSGINFGNFQTTNPYWTSNQADLNLAMAQQFSTGLQAEYYIFNFPFLAVRCTRTATYPVP